MEPEYEYWEGPGIHDLTYDEMVDEIESYIKFVRHVNFVYSYFEYSGYVRLGFAEKHGSGRWELVCFEPPLDSIYTTTDVVDAMCEKYPDLISDAGRYSLYCEKCGSVHTTMDSPEHPVSGFPVDNILTCNECGHVERHGMKSVHYRHHDIYLEW